jgi:hypothetical protein
MSSSRVMHSFQLLQELQVAQMERLNAVIASSSSGATVSSLTRSTGPSAVRLDRYAKTLGPLVETDNETDGDTSPAGTPFSSTGLTPKENTTTDYDRKRLPRTHSWNLDRSPMTEYNRTQTSEIRSNQLASDEKNKLVNFGIEALPSDEHNESTRESLVLLMSTTSQEDATETGFSVAQHEKSQGTLENDARQPSFSTTAAHFSPNREPMNSDRSSMGRDSFDSTYTIPSIATELQRDSRMDGTRMDESEVTAGEREPLNGSSDAISSHLFVHEDLVSAVDPTSNGPSRQPPFPRLHPRDAVDTQRSHSVAWSSPLDATRRAYRSGILPEWRFSLDEHCDSSQEALAFDDDTRSVDTSETPVLDRYQLATDDSSPHGFVVLPNPRRQHTSKGIVAFPHKSPFQRYSARRDEMEALQTVTEQSSSADSGASDTMHASASPNAQPEMAGEPAASHSTLSLPQELARSDSPSPKAGHEDLRGHFQEWPRLQHITEPEYSAAPRLIQLQTTYEELQMAVSVLNDFLFRLTRTNASPSLTFNLTDGGLLTNSAVHQVLGDTFPVERKRKSIIYALCHCQKMRMVLPRSANEEVAFHVATGNT